MFSMDDMFVNMTVSLLSSATCAGGSALRRQLRRRLLLSWWARLGRARLRRSQRCGTPCGRARYLDGFGGGMPRRPVALTPGFKGHTPFIRPVLATACDCISLCTKTTLNGRRSRPVSGRGRESRASSEATVCLMSINAAPTFIFNLWLSVQTFRAFSHVRPARSSGHGQARYCCSRAV